MKTRIKVVERANGKVECYPQFKGWWFWHFFGEPTEKYHDAYREALAQSKFAYGSEETTDLDFALAVIAKWEEMEEKRKAEKAGLKIKAISYLVEKK